MPGCLNCNPGTEGKAGDQSLDLRINPTQLKQPLDCRRSLPCLGRSSQNSFQRLSYEPCTSAIIGSNLVIGHKGVTMVRFWFSIGCLLAGLAVGAGAFGAHALRQRLPAELLAVFETGVRYQMYHAFGIIAIALAQDRWTSASLQVPAWLFLFGILLFSGSLYGLCLSGNRSWGAVTPLGGLCFLAGWLWLVCSVWQAQTTQ